MNNLLPYAALMALVMTWVSYVKSWPIIHKIFGEISGWKSVVLVMIVTLIVGFAPEFKTVFSMLNPLVQKALMLVAYGGSFAGLYKIGMDVADKVGGNGK